MTLNKITIKDDEGFAFDITEQFTGLAKKNIFVRDVLKRRDISFYKFFVNDEEIPFDNLFELYINVKDVGPMAFFLKKDSFDKDQLINDVSALKDLKIESIRDVNKKLLRVNEVMEKVNPLFALCDFDRHYLVDEALFANVTYQLVFVKQPETLRSEVKIENLFIWKKKDQTTTKEETKPVEQPAPTIEAKPVSCELPAEEETPKEHKSSFIEKIKAKVQPLFAKKEKQKIPEVKEEENKESKGIKINFKALLVPFKLIKADYLTFLFELIAAFLITFTLCIGLFNAYQGTTIFIFFFICCAIGAALNGYIYYDLYYENKPTTMVTIMSNVITAIGYGASIGLFAVYYNSVKDKPEDIPGLSELIMQGALIGLAVTIAGIIIAYVISKILKKNKKAEEAK